MVNKVLLPVALVAVVICGFLLMRSDDHAPSAPSASTQAVQSAAGAPAAVYADGSDAAPSAPAADTPAAETAQVDTDAAGKTPGRSHAKSPAKTPTGDPAKAPTTEPATAPASTPKPADKTEANATSQRDSTAPRTAQAKQHVPPKHFDLPEGAQVAKQVTAAEAKRADAAAAAELKNNPTRDKNAPDKDGDPGS